MKKILLIIFLSQLLASFSFGKNLNLILDCKSSTNSAYNVFIQIKNDKAAVANSKLEYSTKVNDNFIEIDIGSTFFIEINRYTLDYTYYRYNVGYKGSCKKLRKKIF